MRPPTGFDANCDGIELCYVDADGDEVGGDSMVRSADLQCTEHAVVGGDCDDADADVGACAQVVGGGGCSSGGSPGWFMGLVTCLLIRRRQEPRGGAGMRCVVPATVPI